MRIWHNYSTLTVLYDYKKGGTGQTSTYDVASFQSSAKLLHYSSILLVKDLGNEVIWHNLTVVA